MKGSTFSKWVGRFARLLNVKNDVIIAVEQDEKINATRIYNQNKAEDSRMKDAWNLLTDSIFDEF